MSARSRPRLLVALVLSLALFATACGDLEPLSNAEAMQRLGISTTKLYASDGSLIADLHGEVDREIVSLEEIPQHVQDAVVAIEDRRFWTHGGVDLQAIFRALVANVRDEKTLQGGSTISQQLVKNLYFPDPERTLQRKVEEARLTLDFEGEHTKERILEMYLNTVYFGRGVYGIQTAARSYFRKDAKDLTVADAAFLAGLIHEPGRYEFSPSDPEEKREPRKEAAMARRDLVLDLMLDQKLITAEQREEAKGADLVVEERREREWKHPYFVDLILRQLGVLRNGSNPTLQERFDFLGETVEERARSVYSGGLRIHTTLDPEAQRTAEESIAEILPDDLDRLSSAVVSIEPGSGAIRALVGGRDYYPECPQDAPTEELSHVCRLAKVNLAIGEDGGGSGRQPGSAFKPLVLAAALEEGISLRRGYSSSAFAHDLPVGEWTVRNYAGSGGGHMSIFEGTVRSVNAVYARLEIHGLGDGDALAGSGKVAGMARRLGIPFESEESIRERCGDRYGFTGDCTAADSVPAIALGAKEVSPLHLASAYATLANRGEYVEPTAITKITDRSGKVLYEAEPERKRAIDQEVADAVNHVLQQVVRRGTGVNARLDRPVAGKTGTAQAWRDAWFAGFVPQLTTVVWVGNPIPVRDDDGTWGTESLIPRNGYPRRITGGSYPAMIWKRFMEPTLDGVEHQGFPEPDRRFFTEQASDEKKEREIQDVEVEPEVQADPRPQPRREQPTARRSSSNSGSVPGVVGMSHASARTTIRRAGFDPASVRRCPPSGGGDGMKVWGQSPGGGSSAPKGSTVTIYYSPAVC